jgi:glutamate carboxypeptidase
MFEKFSVKANAMDKLLKKLIDTLALKTMEDQLQRFCAINSGTSHLAGLSTMAQTLEAAFSPIADKSYIKKLPPIHSMSMEGTSTITSCGDALLLQKRPELARRILLSGHMDTVYDQDHAFQHLTYINDNHLNGPGVTDMKGGLVVMLHALSVFEQSDAAKLMGWDVLINADEEIGSLASAALFDELAPTVQAALVYEPTMTPSGLFAKNRKGSGKLTLIATGKTAHAGRAFDQGRNAICYLAQAITAIHALNDQHEHVTINVGKIAGGDALNVVPDKAVAQLDIRIEYPEEEFWVRNAIESIIQKLQHPDYSLTLHGHFARPVKRVCEGTKRLFHRVQTIGKQLGLSLDWKDSGGCCDGNNLAAHGLPVLDSLGVRGGNIHTSEEYILLDSLPERAALSALLLIDLAQGGLEDLTPRETQRKRL